MTIIRQRDGHTRVYTKDGGHFVCAEAHHGHVLASWKAGLAFVDTLGVWGQPLTIKLAEVTGVSLATATTIAAEQADAEATSREQKARDMLDGGE